MRDRNNLKLYSAVCDECGKSCELPFKPSSGKPVYCSDCFKKKQRAGSGGSNFRNNDRFNFRRDNRSNFRNDNRSNFREKRMYPAICDSCGKRCEVPFQPTSGKPIYCDSCFNKDGNDRKGMGRNGNINRDRNEDQIKEQIATLDRKIDKIIKALKINDPSLSKVVEKEEKKTKKTAKKKAVKKITKKKAVKKRIKKKK